MSSSNRYPLTGKVEVDEFVVGQQKEGVVGRKNKSKNVVIIAIERYKGEVKRIYAQKIDKVDKKTYRHILRIKFLILLK